MLLGRAGELATLLEHLEHRRPAAVVGEAGVGKTALLRLAAGSAGAFVVDAGALSTLKWMPYLPLARALGHRPPGGDRATVVEWVAARTEGGVLLLDDAQWADQETLALLGPLGQQLKLLVGVRLGDPGTPMVSRRLLENGFSVMRLGPLMPEDASQLVRYWAPELADDNVRRIVDGAHGNPLLIEHLAKDGGCSPTLRLSIRACVRRLPPAAKETLSTIGLLGRPVEREFLATGHAEALEAGLIIEDGSLVDVSHPLFGEAAIDQLEVEERLGLHARIARQLRDPGEAARHFAAAGEEGLAYAKAVEAAALAHDPEERAGHLAVAASVASGPDGDRLRLQAAVALIAVGEHERAERLLLDIVSENPVLRAEVALHLAQARLWLDDPAGANRCITEGLELSRGSKLALEVQLRIEHARVAILERDAEPARLRARDAWMLSRAVGSGEAPARCLLGCTRLLEDSPVCLEDFRTTLDEAKRRGDDALECEAEAWLIYALQTFGDTEAAAARADWMVGRSRSLHLRGWETVFRFLRSQLDVRCQGEYERAIPELEDLTSQPALGHHHEEACALLAVALAHVGRDTEARAQLSQAIGQSTGVWGRGSLFLAQAEVEWLAARPQSVLAAVERLRTFPRAGFGHQLALAAALEGWALTDLGFALREPVVALQVPAWEAVTVELEALRKLRIDREPGRAEELFERAGDQWATRWHAGELRCRWAAADAARTAGAATRAEAALLAVREQVVAAHSVTLLGRIHGSLREAGVQAAASSAALSGDGAPGDRITRREREMLRLVGAGLSSKDIAQVLAIAPSTVETQIRSAMRKLGASTRIQAATLVWFRTEDALQPDFETTRMTS